METNTEVSTEVVTIVQPELVELKKHTPLEATKAESILFKYAPFFSQLSEIKKSASKIDFENPTDIDCKIARELRLKIVKIRTGSEAVKTKGKEDVLIIGRLEDSANGVVKNSCLLLEKEYEAVEKFAELREEKRKADLKEERTKVLSQLISNPEIYPLGEITQEAFDDLVNGFKLAKQQRIDAELKAEQERIAKEKADAEEREKQRLENIRLRDEAEAREKEFKAAQAKAEKERQLAALKAKEEQERHDALLQAERDRAAKEKSLADAKLKKEQEAKAKLESEIKAKKAAEEKAEKERLALEKKAALAPDKQKIVAFAGLITSIEMPEVKSEEAKRILKSTQELLNKINSFLLEKSETL